MAESELIALLGFHNPLGVESLVESCQVNGYITEVVASVDEMLEKIGQRDYNRYLMDLNLGSPNSPNIAPAIQVYEAVKAQVASGKAKFLGISSDLQAVKAAREHGIPAESKSNLTYSRLKEFLLQ